MTTFGSVSNKRLDELVELLDIPPSYYEEAVRRYESLNAWFKRPKSSIAHLRPVVFPQGSFRLGTVIRPVFTTDEYDLDVVCQLVLLRKTELSQRDLKQLVGREVRAYATAHGIEAPVTEGKRAWRLDYADGVKFHIDILACVPEDEAVIRDLVVRHRVQTELAATAVALTCKSHPHYEVRSSNWPTSNPIGFATWFEGRMARFLGSAN